MTSEVSVRPRAFAVCLFAFLSVSCPRVWATPPNTALLDGRPLEYDATDHKGTNLLAGLGNFGANNTITNLFVSWDTNYLYIALQAWEAGNKFAVMIDVDPGNGTGASTTTNWADPAITQDFIRYNDAGWRKSTDGLAREFGLDYMIASEGFFNSILRIRADGFDAPTTNNLDVMFDHGNGATPQGTPVDMVVQADGTTCNHKGLEARIPWSELYTTNNRFGAILPGEVIPREAVLRVFAILHDNTPNSATNASDVIPAQISSLASFANGLLTSDDYIDISIDNADTNGFPDFAETDPNAPWIRDIIGAAGQRTVYARFNEPVTQLTVEDAASWSINGEMPGSVTADEADSVLIQLTNDLPGAGTVVPVSADGVEDIDGNSRVVEICLFPTDTGVSTSVTVRFVLDVASGMGQGAVPDYPLGATNFFLNGGNIPLDFGFPPATSAPLALLSSTNWYYRDVTFPPGTPTKIRYKYSARLKNTGTNTYEAVRLDNYLDVARELTLVPGSEMMIVTDYLGAAAAPLRSAGVTNFGQTAYELLYNDARRGDAGVRRRTTLLFQLDLSQRDANAFDRVLIQGTDPLRGFNSDGAEGDFADLVTVGWDVGGLEMFDDGFFGDLTAGDGIYSRAWSLSPDGLDTEFEPFDPFSLVGGNNIDTKPWLGDNWVYRRTPRSFKYKFYVVKDPGGADVWHESPGADIEVYLQQNDTNIVFDPFVWENNALPPPPPSNSPTLDEVVLIKGQAVVLFTNEVSEGAHGVQISTNLLTGWLDFGTRATQVLGDPGAWTALVYGVAASESYRAYAGPPSPFVGVWWEPNPVPAGGGVMRIYYTQHGRLLAGDRFVQIAGTFNGWTPQPMTFQGDGTWYFDATIGAPDPNNIEFKPRNLSGSLWQGMGGDGPGQPNFRAYKDTLRATWDPNMPTNRGNITITYDATGGPLAAATNVNVYLGFEEFWLGASNRPMTNIGGVVWQRSVTIPSNYFQSVNFVFNNQGCTLCTTNWDSENDGGGRQWRAFMPLP